MFGRTMLQNAILAAGVSLAPLLAGSHPAQAAPTHEGWLLAERLFDFERDQPAYGTPRRHGGNGWYGGGYPDDNVGRWAIGTFRGQNGANGYDETITIHPDGSAELRVRGEQPRYGSFAGETLTFDRRISRVQPARGGIVVDGAYYQR